MQISRFLPHSLTPFFRRQLDSSRENKTGEFLKSSALINLSHVRKQTDDTELSIEDRNTNSGLLRRKIEERRRSSTFLRNRKGGKAGIISEIEDKERDEQIITRPKVLFTQRGDKRKDLLLEHHVGEKFSCSCSVCMGASGANRFDIYLKLNSHHYDFQEQSTMNQDLDKDFNFVLKKLQPVKNIQRGLRLYVPDTAAFSGGEVKYVVMTGKDKTLKFIKQKDKLTLHELRKFFHERRRRKDDLPYGGSDEFDTLNLQKGVSNISDNAHETLSIGKTIDGIAKDTDNINTREVALVKFRDDSTQILTEMEFNHFLLKRKVDKIWKDVQFMQTFTRTKKGLANVIQSFYIYEKDKRDPLFERSKYEILYLNGDLPQASEDYISLGEEERFEDDLRNASPKQYCHYLLYKVVHYLEIISLVKVHKFVGEFVKDESGFYWLINISRIQYDLLQERNPEDLHMKNVENIVKEENSKLTTELEAHYKNLERKEAAKLLNDIMQQHYDSMKKNLNFKMIENYYDDNISDDVFHKIHPDAPFKLSELLRCKIKYEDIRDFVVKNCDRLRGERYYKDGNTISKAVKHYHSQDHDPNQSIAIKETSFRSHSVQRNNSVSYRQNNSSGFLPNMKGMQQSKMGRSTTSVDRGRSRSPSPYKYSAEVLDERRQSQNQLTSTGNVYAQVFFRAVKYVRGRKSQKEDDPSSYLCENEDEDPAVSMYYQKQQSIRSLNHQRSSSIPKGRATPDATLTQGAGTSFVMGNLSRSIFTGIPLESEPQQTNERAAKEAKTKSKSRLTNSFFESLPNQRPKISNLAVLLQDSGHNSNAL